MNTATELATSAFSRRIPELDGIRGLAILAVLIWHYGIVISEPAPGTFAAYAQGILGLTWSGVDLFFVLSGFLIGGILLDNRDAANYLKVFYIRRVCRIFPIYFLWLAFFMALVTFFPALTTKAPVNWLFQNTVPVWTYATFTQNVAMAQAADFGSGWLAPTWSLAVEEQFYLLLPVFIYFVSRRWLPYLLVGVIVAAPILRLGLFFAHPYPRFASYMLMPCRADALLLGVLCAYVMRQPRLAQAVARRRRLLYAALTLLLLGVGALLVATMQAGLLGPFVLHPFAYTWLALLYACFLLIAITEKRGVVSALTRLRWLQSLGSVSYGVYIYHVGVLGLAHILILRQEPQIKGWLDAAITGVALLATLAVSHLSWKYFEQPIVAFGHSFSYRKASPPAPVPSLALAAKPPAA